MCYHGDMKKCKRCEEEKPLDYFSVDKARKDGFSRYCKPCKSVYQKDYYNRNKRKYLDQIYERRKDRKTETIILLIGYFREHPCVDCGETDPIVLEFDHQRDKKCNVAELVGAGYSWESILKEIEKCEVCCRNCHTRRAAKQQNWQMLNYIKPEWTNQVESQPSQG